MVQQLLSEYPRLRNFATLSPIPGFSRWLDKKVEPAYRERIPADVLAVLEGTGKSGMAAIQHCLAAEIGGAASAVKCAVYAVRVYSTTCSKPKCAPSN